MRRLTLVAIIVGGSLIALGLLVIGTTVGQTGREDVRIAGLLLDAFGAMAVAIPLYVDARRIQAENRRAMAQTAKKRGTSPCVLCGLENATFWCTTHTVRLCPDCVPKHNDAARCLYKPLLRNQASRA